MFNFFKRKNKNPQDLVDEHGNVIQKSSLVSSRAGDRFLKLANDDCGIILHPGNNVEVIFTKLYDLEKQTITDNEESLMALALFMKQPGFLELIKKEFRHIAMERVTSLTNNNTQNDGN